MIEAQEQPDDPQFDYGGLDRGGAAGERRYRSGQRLEWDAKRLKVTNAPEAMKWIDPPHRSGWEV
jgi:hypothetical protein